jgi:hypothetical protein
MVRLLGALGLQSLLLIKAVRVVCRSAILRSQPSILPFYNLSRWILHFSPAARSRTTVPLLDRAPKPSPRPPLPSLDSGWPQTDYAAVVRSHPHTLLPASRLVGADAWMSRLQPTAAQGGSATSNSEDARRPEGMGDPPPPPRPATKMAWEIRHLTSSHSRARA